MAGDPVSAKDILSREEFKALLNEVLDERQELVGMPTNSVEARADHKKDAEFLRSLRLGVERAVSGAATWFIRAFIIGLLVIAGIGGKKMGGF